MYMRKVQGNLPSFLEGKEYLAIDSTVPSATTEPKLVVKKDGAGFEFISSNGAKKIGLFRTETSEYKILMHLVSNHHVPFQTGKLSDQLNDPRGKADNPDKKQRVLDKIRAIRKKLGDELIKTTPKGYIIDCEIIRE